MNRLAIASIIVAGCLLLTLGGCLQLGEPGGVDSATASRLAAEIPIYQSSNPLTDGYKNLGAVSAWSCDDTLLHGSGGRDQLVAKLRQEAAKVDADALIDLSCGRNADAVGCIKSLKCEATAARLKDAAAR